MPINLIKQAESLFHETEIAAVSKAFGEHSEKVRTAINIIVPFLFFALLKKEKETGDTEHIISLANGQANKLTQTRAEKPFVSGDGDPDILKLFLKEKTSLEFENNLSDFTQISKETSRVIIGMSTVAVLAFLGKYIQSNNLNTKEVHSLLQSQENNITEALPANFYTSLNYTNASNKKNCPDLINSNFTDEPNRGLANGLKWLIPLFLLAVSGAVVLYYTKDDNYEVQKNIVILNADSTVKGSGTLLVNWNNNPGDMDSSWEFKYNEGKKVNIDLPHKEGNINVGENSTEARLITFLQSSHAIDTGRGNWFEFTNVHFTSGTTILSDSSLIQLQNIAKITKAFPTAIFKIGGYTDSTSNEDANLKLCKSRAAVVAQKIINFGARPFSISGSDGYGSHFALMENFTAAGRSLNRRVAINIKAK